VILNQLLSLSLSHFIERIVGTSEVTCKTLKSLNNAFLNLKSLFISDTRTKRVTVEVSTNSDTCTLNHRCIFLRERRSYKLSCIHIWCMLICFLVFMIVGYDKIEEILKLVVRIVATSVYTNAWVCVFASREDSLLEREAILVFLVSIFSPNLFGEVLHQRRFCSSRENREPCKVFWGL
jgi:hypothetical protein